VVVGVEPDVLQVVVLSAGPYAFLGVRGARVAAGPGAQRDTSGARSPRNIGTNWFIPALVNRSPGESGRSEDDGTTECPRAAKKSRNDRRISDDVIGRR